jgi:hypothetical protein
VEAQRLCLLYPLGLCFKVPTEQGDLVWRQVRAMALAFDSKPLFEDVEDGGVALSYLFGKLVYPQHEGGAFWV